MGHSKYFMRLVLASASVFLFACSRANEETSKLSIQLPSAASSSSSKKIETLGGTATVGTEWAGTIPNDVNSFNCYAVAITGPEPILNRNRCGKKIAAGSEDFTSDLYFGPIVGIQPAGTELNIDVMSGEGRQVILMGFVSANPTTDCMQYNSESLDKSKLSKPYIIGRSDKLSLKPGVDVSVPVKMTYDSNQFIEKCEGPEFTKPTSSTNIATQVSLEKDTFPKGATLENACNPLTVSLRDPSYRLASATTPTQIGIKLSNVQTTNDPLMTYETYTNCLALSGGSTSFAIPVGSTQAKRWFKTDLVASITSNSFDLDLSATTLKLENFNSTHNLKNGVTTDVKLLITGPQLVVAGQCYKYDLSYRKFDKTYLSGDSRTVAFSLANGAMVYETPNCTGMPNTATSVSATRTTYSIDIGAVVSKSIYINFPAGGITSLLKLEKGNSTFTNAEPDSLSVFASASDTRVVGITTREDKALPKKPYTCFGPFFMELVNSYGIAVPNLSAANIDMALATAMPSDTGLSDKYDCTASVTSITIPTGKSYGLFYIKTLTNPPTGSFPLEFYNATTGLRLNFSFSVN